MSTTPITTADSLILTAICNKVAPLITGGRCYQLVAPVNTPRPYVVVQMQSDVLTAHTIGRTGATGLVTIKAVADTLTMARSVRDAACAGMATVTVAGYDLTIEYRSTPSLPFDGSAYQSGNVYRFTLR